MVAMVAVALVEMEHLFMLFLVLQILAEAVVVHQAVQVVEPEPTVVQV
jgi:hypothetical protein